MSDNLSLDSLLNSIVNGEQETGLNKEASEANVSAADELQNLLNTKVSDSAGEQTEMSKVAAVNTGKQIADGILNMLTKQAENMVQYDINQMEQQHDQRIDQNPVQGKTVAEMAKAIMDRAASNGGAAAPERTAQEVAAEGRAQDPALAAGPSDLSKQASEAVGLLIADGASFDEAVALVKQAQEELVGNYLEMEKAAAVDQLVSEGYDFDDAVELVKQASAELYGEEEYSEIEKSAAVNQLVSEGIDFETAAELVKEAAAVKWVAKTGKDKAIQAAKYAASALGGAATGAGAVAALRRKK